MKQNKKSITEQMNFRWIVLGLLVFREKIKVIRYFKAHKRKYTTFKGAAVKCTVDYS